MSQKPNHLQFAINVAITVPNVTVSLIYKGITRIEPPHPWENT